jgi:adenine phosphoribosyltransferase
MINRLHGAVRTIENFPEPGIQFKDITPILADPELLRFAVNALSDPFRSLGISRVIGIEARGFILGAMIADELGAGFVPVRKRGKLPFRTVRESYDLEYGSDVIEMHEDAIPAGERVLIHDDVIATGGTANATRRLVERSGGIIQGFSFLIEIDALNGRFGLGPDYPVVSILHF